MVLCGSCFWCVSCVNVGKKMVTKCPNCGEARLESIPNDNEIYKFRYDPGRGVILEFSKSGGVDRIRG